MTEPKVGEVWLFTHRGTPFTGEVTRVTVSPVGETQVWGYWWRMDRLQEQWDRETYWTCDDSVKWLAKVMTP